MCFVPTYGGAALKGLRAYTEFTRGHVIVSRRSIFFLQRCKGLLKVERCTFGRTLRRPDISGKTPFVGHSRGETGPENRSHPLCEANAFCSNCTTYVVVILAKYQRGRRLIASRLASCSRGRRLMVDQLTAPPLRSETHLHAGGFLHAGQKSPRCLLAVSPHRPNKKTRVVKVC